MDHQPAYETQKYSTTSVSVVAPSRTVPIVYYLSYKGGLLEQPHLLEVSTSSSTGLCLKDVKRRLMSLRGRAMPSAFSWSYKRSYKQGYVWQDLESDDDLIFPAHGGSEYVLKGSKIESPCITILASPPKMPRSLAKTHNISTSMNPMPTRTTEIQTIAKQHNKVANCEVLDEDANKKNMVGSSANATLRVCGDDIMVNRGLIEGLEHLKVAKEGAVHYEYAESQASTSCIDNSIAMEQSKVAFRNLGKKPCVSSYSYVKEHALEDPVDREEFTIIAKEACGGALFSSSGYITGANVATQTGEEDEHPKASVHIESKAICPIQAAGSTSSRRNGKSSKHKVITGNVLMELHRWEISPPACSTSSSTTASAHSASGSRVVSHNIDCHPKLKLDQSTCSTENQILKETDVLFAASGHLNHDVDSEKVESTEIELASGVCNDGIADSVYLTTSSLSADVDGKLRYDRKAPSNSSFRLKPHVLSVCSSSGRFLHLVSCGRGLEVIKPSNIATSRRRTTVRDMHAEHDCEQAMGVDLSLLKSNNDSPGMEYTSLINDASASGLPQPDAADDLPGVYLPLGHVVDNDTMSASAGEGNTGIKKLWHFKGWVNSHYKKIKSPKTKGTSATCTAEADDDPYACVEKHVPNSNHVEESTPQCRLIRTGSIDYSLDLPNSISNCSSNQLIYKLMNGRVTSPSPSPSQPRRQQRRKSTSSACSILNGFDGNENQQLHAWRRSNFPVFGLDTCTVSKGAYASQRAVNVRALHRRTKKHHYQNS